MTKQMDIANALVGDINKRDLDLTSNMNTDSIIDGLVNNYASSNEFSSDEFANKLESVRLSTIEDLKKYYKTDDVQVRLVDHHRDFESQKNNKTHGHSKADIGLHNFGAAGDFSITIDGVLQTAQDNNTIKPYQILGANARNHDLFWGWGWDSGHVAETRWVDQFIKEYPEQALNPGVRNWYDMKNEEASIDSVYQPLLKILDNVYDESPSRSYHGSGRTADELLQPIVVEKPEFAKR